MTTNIEHQIGFEQLGLGSILKRYQLVVPPNQRDYKWDEREVKQLFQDLARAMGTGDYFLGSVVIIPRDDSLMELVDGQQRLATTAILLSAIRDYLKDKDKIVAESIDNEFLTGIDRVKRARVPKLKLNLDDNELFSCIVTGEGDIAASTRASRESHQLLLQAQQFAKDHVKNVVSTFDVKDHGDVLNRWISFIEHQALVVLLRVPNNADAFRMFETLNDRGVRANQADLVKNYLFGRSGERFGEVQSRWSYMRGALETLGEEDITIEFLRYALIVTGGEVTEAAVYERVQETVKSDQSALEFVTMLENMGNIYVASFNPEHERWADYTESVRRAIRIFNVFDIKPMRPLIMAISARMDIKETARAFEFLTSLGIRLLIATTIRSGSISSPLASTATKVYEGTIDSTAGLQTALRTITPSDTEFKEAFSKARVSNAKFARYYLRSLEMTAQGETEPWYGPIEDSALINLEHILPRKPEGNWPQFSDDETALYNQRLGNLALLQASTNADLRSADFTTNRTIYAESPYVLTSQIAELDSWTTATITDRQERLAELAVKTWPA